MATTPIQWDEAAEGWRRWEPHFTASTWPITLRMIGMLRLRPDSAVLDVGCGVGDPALAIAAVLGEGGTVLAIDPSPGMAAAAQARAERLGLANVTFQTCAAEQLHGYETHFDAISARWSILFFEDVVAGLTYLRSKLRVGGRIAVSAWTTREENPMFAIPARALAEVVELPKPGRDEPNLLRLSEEGELTGALTEAGFGKVSEQKVKMFQYARDPEDYWEFLMGVSLPFRKTVQRLEPTDQRRVREGVLRSVVAYRRDGMVQVPALARVAAAERI